MTKTYISIEILHTMPFSNANRDDAGLPKTATIGGSMRGRLSSQALKRAARFHQHEALTGQENQLGYVRTQMVAQAIIERLQDKKADPDVIKAVQAFLSNSDAPLGKGSAKKEDDIFKVSALVVLTEEELNKIADLFIAADGKAPKSEDIINILKKSNKKDIALWGRFFASGTEVTLDGSAQVAHAFTTHPIELESDFFVGMDDLREVYTKAPGAGHPGDAFFSSGTFYKYANVNLGETVANLANYEFDGKVATSTMSQESLLEVSKEIIQKFIEDFAASMPQGKIRSTAHTTIPSYVRVTVQNGQPLNSAPAFEKAVTAQENIIDESIIRLGNYHAAAETFLGNTTAAFYWTSQGIEEGSEENHGVRAKTLAELIEKVLVHAETPLVSAAATFLQTAE